MSTDDDLEQDVELVDDLEEDDPDGEPVGDAVPGTRKKTRKRAASDPSRHADGHTLIQGARWHYPRQGHPTVCAIDGCDRVLGEWRNHDPLDALEADDESSEPSGVS